MARLKYLRWLLGDKSARESTCSWLLTEIKNAETLKGRRFEYTAVPAAAAFAGGYVTNRKKFPELFARLRSVSAISKPSSHTHRLPRWCVSEHAGMSRVETSALSSLPSGSGGAGAACLLCFGILPPVTSTLSHTHMHTHVI